MIKNIVKIMLALGICAFFISCDTPTNTKRTNTSINNTHPSPTNPIGPNGNGENSTEKPGTGDKKNNVTPNPEKQDQDKHQKPSSKPSDTTEQDKLVTPDNNHDSSDNVQNPKPSEDNSNNKQPSSPTDNKDQQPPIIPENNDSNSGDVTVNPQAQKYDIKYIDCGTCDMTSFPKTYTKGTTVKLQDPKSSIDKLNFKGWYLSSDYSTNPISEINEDTLKIVEDSLKGVGQIRTIALYAKWDGLKATAHTVDNLNFWGYNESKTEEELGAIITNAIFGKGKLFSEGKLFTTAVGNLLFENQTGEGFAPIFHKLYKNDKESEVFKTMKNQKLKFLLSIVNYNNESEKYLILHEYNNDTLKSICLKLIDSNNENEIIVGLENYIKLKKDFRSSTILFE